MKEKGQVVVLLLLVMLVALAIGLSTISRSTVEVSTSRKSEDSSRAFSAAEAGIEKALGQNSNNIGGTPIQVTLPPFANSAVGTVTTTGRLPIGALEFPPFGKESFAQLWLANPVTLTRGYTGTSFDVYFGDPNPSPISYASEPQNKPAIEIYVTYKDAAGAYQTFPQFQYFDSFSSPRSSGFIQCDPSPSPITTNNNLIPSTFYCKATVRNLINTTSSYPIMVRIRFLYTNIPHPLAISPVGAGNLFPTQVNIYKASGTSGNTKRTLEVFQQKDVMPGVFDYALFSATSIEKN